VTQAVEHLPYKHKALSSNPVLPRQEKKAGAKTTLFSITGRVPESFRN
jgi:hypothetical protein